MFNQLNPKVETLIWSGATVIFIIVASYLVAQAARWLAARFRLNQQEQQQIFWGFLFASPWIIGFVIFVVGPSLASLYYSFTDYRLGRTPEWIGVENYRKLIQAVGRDGRNFRAAMYNSLYYAVIGVPLQVTAALVMAMLLNTTLKGIRTFRLIYYMPVILAGGPAILLAWRYMLAANGGFINESLNAAGRLFPPFDWLYRAFIYSVEAFNGFFIGIARGDPTGPLNFWLPAFIGLLIFFVLLRRPDNRTLPQRAAEIIIFGIGSLLALVGLVAQPVDMTWLFVFTLAALFGVIINLRLGQPGMARAWQIAGLVALFILGGIALISSSAPDATPTKGALLLAIAGCVAAVGVTFVPKQARSPFNLTWAAVAVLIVIILARVLPSNLGAGRIDIVWKYLTLQSAIERPGDLEYLQRGFMDSYMDSVWVFGLLALLAVIVLVLGDQNARWRRYVVAGSFAFFLVMTISSTLDSLRYFDAYQQIADETGTTNFHFARYRNSINTWPDANHNPKWLTSDLWVKPSVILINMWSAGAGMLIFLAALKGVPKSLYEAATVDGASRTQRFFKITLPMISPAMFYNVVIGMIAALQTFDIVYILRNTETETSVMSAAFYLYRRTFEQANIGEGSAMSWVLALIIVGLTIAQFRYSNWVNYEV